MLMPLREWQHSPPEPRQLREAAVVLREKAGKSLPGLNSPRLFEASLQRLLSGGGTSLRARDDMVLASNLNASSELLDGACIVESNVPCTELLSRWHRRASDPLLGTLLWKAVFIAYFLLGDNERHKQLSSFLLDAWSKLPMSGMQPRWVAVAERHRRVLGTGPAQAYVEEWFAGKSDMLDDLQGEVDIPRGSWFWTAFVDSIIQRVELMDDATFASHVPRLVALPERFPAQLDRILSALVERGASKQTPLDANLLENVISHWGNPQLELSSRSFRWSQVSIEARLWVCQCLAEEDLADFFELIKQSSSSLSAMDQRRFAYWKRFTGSMQFTKLVLGPAFRSTNNRDISKFIAKRRERLGWLRNANAQNIAIVMKLGGYWFVEFAETGNACYGYEETARPFEVNSRELSLLELKNKRAAAYWLSHSGQWEHEFDRTLSAVKIWPNGVKHGRSRPSTSNASHATGTSTGSHALPTMTVDLQSELRSLTQDTVDNRAKGGNYWIETSGIPSARLLEAMKVNGYRFASGRGFYR